MHGGGMLECILFPGPEVEPEKISKTRDELFSEESGEDTDTDIGMKN